MQKILNMPEDAREYFDNLPKIIQVEIIQSGVKINSLEDIKNLYSKIVNKH